GGVESSGIVVSRFENATVVQNWDTHNHRIECSVIDPKPWIGSVRIAGPQAGQTWELREDHPWLAYHEQNGNTVLEAVRLDPKGVKGVSEGTGAGAATLRELAGHSGIQFLVGRRVASYHRAISQSP